MAQTLFEQLTAMTVAVTRVAEAAKLRAIYP